MHDPCSHTAFGDINTNGECCCNCEWQRPINAHPWNKDPLVKGRITEIVGYGCTCPEFFPNITFSEQKHSLCECWTENTYRAKMAAQELEDNKKWVWDILKREPNVK